MIKIYLLSGLIFISWSCKENTSITACNPEEGRFINGTHYVAGNMLSENQNWNYVQMQEYQMRRTLLYPDKNCIPISIDKKFEHYVDDLTEILDYDRHIFEQESYSDK